MKRKLRLFQPAAKTLPTPPESIILTTTKKKKDLRSRFPRRQRLAISPILIGSSERAVLPNSFMDSSSVVLTCSEISCASTSRVSVNKPAKPMKYGLQFGKQSSPTLTRVHSRNRERERGDDAQVECSETESVSCADSRSNAVADEVSEEFSRKLKNAVRQAKAIERIDDSDGVAREVVASVEVESYTQGNRIRGSYCSRTTEENAAVSACWSESLEDAEQTNSVLKQIEVSCESSIDTCKIAVEKATNPPQLDGSNVATLRNMLQQQLSETTTGNFPEKIDQSSEDRAYLDVLTFNASTSHAERESTLENSEMLGMVAANYDLACSENLSHGDVSDDHSSAYSEIFPENSELDLSEYSSSIWCDSGSQFSERSSDSSPSPTFKLFHEFTQQYSRRELSSMDNAKEFCSFEEEHSSPENTSLGLENEEQEEAYTMIKKRERRQTYTQDYANDYCLKTDFGELIIQQRLKMVHWIIEHSINQELQKETMFLGVSLLDRFLSKGYFRSKRNLQLAGIACLTLAIRIEENQPFNSVRQKRFRVENTSYSRCEVVAMEWLIQGVLNFKCYLPTVHSFLWFYLKAVRACEKVEKTAKYLSVLVLLGHEQLCFWPSTVAASLVIIALMAEHKDSSCPTIRKTHAAPNEDDLSLCIKSLAWLMNYIS